jgi:replicative DNA helicase
LPFFIDDRRGQTLDQIATRTRRMQAKLRRHGRTLGLLIIDHMQRIRPDGAYRGNKVAETTEVARGLKNLAGSLDVPILCLSQLNRAVESRDDKKPILSDLRESGAIEEEADMVLLLHRPEFYASKGRREAEARGVAALVKWETALAQAEGYMLIDAAKVRHGEPKEVKARCDIKHNFIGERMT